LAAITHKKLLCVLADTGWEEDLTAWYMDDIVITGDDTKGIDILKNYLQKHFHTKYLGLLKYFLVIEVATSKKSILLSHKK